LKALPRVHNIDLCYSLFANFAAIRAMTDNGYGDVVITLDANNTVTLEGINMADLHVDAFTFVRQSFRQLDAPLLFLTIIRQRKEGRTTMKMLQTTMIAIGGLVIGGLAATLLQAQTTAPGYVVVGFAVTDPDGFKEYSQRAPATITQYGGKFTVRGGKIEKLAGDAPKGPYLVLAFASAEQAKTWASSPEYNALLQLRDTSAVTRAFIVEGVAPGP
jgi:uncharacterized protein (DUF1330 family)